MGTRADFYINRGKEAKWIGSIAWDGYPSAISKEVLKAKTETDFIEAFNNFVKDRDDYTDPSMGWPWPWNDSTTTDYAYAFDMIDNKVYVSCFGGTWSTPSKYNPKNNHRNKKELFPDMSRIKKVALDGSGNRSGLMILHN